MVVESCFWNGMYKSGRRLQMKYTKDCLQEFLQQLPNAAFIRQQFIESLQFNINRQDDLT